MTRVGIGYDIHRLVPGRRLFLGGAQVPYASGFLGHSDGDIVLHALCDALLGAMGERDIGTHFPPGDPAFKDISSIRLLEKVRKMMDVKGWKTVNADVMIVLEEPKVSSFVPAMKEGISRVLGIGLQDISIKATTPEGLGPIGAKEAGAAHAVVLIEKVSKKTVRRKAKR